MKEERRNTGYSKQGCFTTCECGEECPYGGHGDEMQVGKGKS